MKKLKIIVGGNIGLFPTGGATWDYVQYPLGLKLLGHDVYYLEDTGRYPIFQNDKKLWDDASDCVEYLKGVMDKFGFENNWAYRDVASQKTFGMTEKKLKEVCESADVFINISCSTMMRDEYLKIPNRFLIDSDPMFTQMQYVKEIDAETEDKIWSTKRMIENHNYLFTFGLNINDPDCKIPKYNYNWIPTRQPICMDYWKNNDLASEEVFTSVMNWSGRKKIIYDQQEWGQKDSEFEKFKIIPSLERNIKFEAVINAPLNIESSFDPAELTGIGWKILSPKSTVANSVDYQNYIFNSAAEFSVAKETYVKSNSGWFSCRSACYLASSKPVIAQETGWSKYIPTGKGLFAFDDEQSAVEALREVKSSLKYHSKEALKIAKENFASEIVLTEMLQKI